METRSWTRLRNGRRLGHYLNRTAKGVRDLKAKPLCLVHPQGGEDACVAKSRESTIGHSE